MDQNNNNVDNGLLKNIIKSTLEQSTEFSSEGEGNFYYQLSDETQLSNEIVKAKIDNGNNASKNDNESFVQSFFNIFKKQQPQETKVEAEKLQKTKAEVEKDIKKN